MQKLLAVAVFEFAFDHITFAAQRLTRCRTAARLQVIGERSLAHGLFFSALAHFVGD